MDTTRSLSQTTAVEEAPLRVLVDGRKLFDGGIGVYTRNCVSGLLASGHFVGVITTQESYEAAKELKLSWLEAVSIHIDNAGRYSLDEYVGLAKRVPVKAYDVFHSPHYTLPYGVSIPTVVTIHDLIHITHPEKRFYPFVARRLITSAIKRADLLVTVSNASANALREEFGEAVNRKLAVIPNAVTQRGSENHRPEADKPFFLSVFSTLKEHKGFNDLMMAYNNYVSRAGDGALPLVLVGQGFADPKTAYARIAQYGLGTRVHVLGKVSDEKLQTLYTQAKALVVPSLAEGFCLPVIEAHAAGTAVVSRPVPAISELVISGDTVAKDFAVLSFADSLLFAAEREVNRLELHGRFNRLIEEQFSSEVTTAKLVQVYRTAIDGEGDAA
jgi:glycosyltransferase involved in cell wall biosynthesis